MQRILGIDPGSRVTGYGIIVSDGVRSRHLVSGCIRLDEQELSQRLGEIYRRVAGLVAEYAPDELAIEQVFVARNPASALKLGQARGAAICAAVVAGLPVSEYTPRMVKQSVVGSGSADKEQVQHMVKRILGLHESLAADQADALAVAISHAHASGLRLRSGALRGGGR
ncbi:MAG: crossover junction endodeoxyribonuclease RuvC [Chromatiaceae bacterium]|nr:crossover junction endodeoxyribonuclease RuvC [Chromatiaceae bacterium]